MPARTLLVEGWRNIAHSYAIVNQFQCLELLKMPDLRLIHRDVPYYGDHWQPMRGLFPPAAEAALDAMPTAGEEPAADAVLRVAFPYNCAASKYRRTIVFGTSEFGHVPQDYLIPQRPLHALMAESDVVLFVPSHWSREGFLLSGACPDRVEVVPHGVDPTIYCPAGTAQPGDAQAAGFTFLTVGSMAGNKGLPLLLKAFAVIAQKYGHVRLVMKGLGALYPSRDLKDLAVGELTNAEAYRVRERLEYVGATMSFAEMADLYRAADAYVSPYMAEGFNLPVLEAAACGTAVICTKGGSTDDFVRPEFALQIEATRHAEELASGARGIVLQPSFDHLVHQMAHAIENPAFRARARLEGPAFVRREFTWRHTAERLIKVLFP